MDVVQRITKPNLVDLLRMCDKNRWTSPRIRYASIRSKPDLCQDLVKFFEFRQEENLITITPLRQIVRFPNLQYDVKSRRFFREGKPFDCARVSRRQPTFRLERKNVTLVFGTLFPAKGSLCSGTAAVASLMFP